MTLRTFLLGSPVAFAIGAIAGWLAGFALSQPQRAKAGSVDQSGVSRHIVCYAGAAKVYEGDSDPAFPYYVGAGSRITFLDRSSKLLISTTVACITSTPYAMR